MFPDIRSILYATDLGPNSIYAFRYAARLAQLTGAEVHILHVLEQLSDDAVVTLKAYIMDDKKRHEILDRRTERAKGRLMQRQDDFWASVSEDHRKVRDQIKSVEVVEDYPAEKILKTVTERGCDLIVMGGHEKGLDHSFLGSVAKSVLRRARIPTLTVPISDES